MCKYDENTSSERKPRLRYLPMTYEGEILLECPSDIDFTNVWAVVVSGDKLNPCGHMLFCCGTSSTDSWYFHVAGQGVGELGGIWGYPKFMRGDSNFYKYLASNGKREIRRLNAKITNPIGAYNKLIEHMASKWFWGVLLNNCVVFARDIVVAGGGSVDVLLNCPDKEFVTKLKGTLTTIGKAAAESSLPYGLGL
jgi:hypothetical protein